MTLREKLHLSHHTDAPPQEQEHDHESFTEHLRNAIGNYLDPLSPDKGTVGDHPDGVPGKPPGAGGATPRSEGLD